VLKPGDPFPPLPFGHTRVSLDRRLVPVPAGPDTLVRRYAALFRPWAVVDQREHLLDFRLPCASNDGTTGMLVDVRVSVMITEPEGAVQRRAGGLRCYVLQEVGLRVGDALAWRPDGVPAAGFGVPLAPLSTALDRVASMHTIRRQVAHGLAGTLRPGTFWLGGFYRVTVVGYSVAFDPVTQGHHDRLVAAARDAERRHLPTG
jgi:hypothetical protein